MNSTTLNEETYQGVKHVSPDFTVIVSESRPLISRWSTRIRFSALSIATVLAASVVYAEENSLELELQTSTDLQASWTKEPPENISVTPDKRLIVRNSHPESYYRLAIKSAEAGMTSSPYVSVERLPTQTVRIAKDHLRWVRESAYGSETGDDHPWKQSQIAPTAIEVYDPSYHGGEVPAYTEFKVISSNDRLNGSVGFL